MLRSPVLLLLLCHLLPLRTISQCISPPRLLDLTLIPTTVAVAFDDSIDYDTKTFRVNASLPFTTYVVDGTSTNSNDPCRQLVVWLGDLKFGERQLPDGSGSLCLNMAPGHLMVDHLYSEQFVYSCCYYL